MDVERLIDFFGIHQDYDRDLHLLLARKESCELARLILERCPGARLHVYSDKGELVSALRRLPGAEANLTLLRLRDAERQPSMGTLLFDNGVDPKRVTALVKKAPSFLVGAMEIEDLSYMPVWEAFRQVSRRIYIRCHLENGKTEVLDWDRRESDVELSVVFPVYNVAAYLDKCFATATAWKAPYVEFLFVNDGSPDNSREIILERARKDARIKLIDKPNGGCASARQAGLDAASGRYVGFIDPDDYIDPDMFRQLLGRALMGGYEMSWCGYNEFYQQTGGIVPVPDTIDGEYWWGTQRQDAIWRLLFAQRVAIWRGIYLKSMLDRCGIAFQTELRRFDDLPFKVEVCAKARSGVAMNKHMYYYRLERPGQDVSCNDERLYVHFDIFRHLDEVIDAVDQRCVKDYLQICKVNTHCFALKMLKDDLVRDYAKKARQDLKRNAGVGRTLRMLWRWMGNYNRDGYLSIMFGCPGLYKRRLNRLAAKQER